jgi:hypothetical protein
LNRSHQKRSSAGDVHEIGDAVASIAAAPQVTDGGGPDLDARQALVYMRDVLDELAEDEEAAQRPSRP